MTIRPMALLATALLLATPGCNCGSKDSGEPGESPSTQTTPTSRADSEVVDAVEQLGDRGAVVIVAQPKRWTELHATLRPLLTQLPPGAAQLVEATDPQMLPGLMSMALGLPGGIDGLDLERPVVASLGEVPFGGAAATVTPQLPVHEGWIPPMRHQILLPAEDTAALVRSLAAALEVPGTPWPALVEGREGARGIELDERDAAALLPEKDAVRVVLFQSGGGQAEDARLEHLRGRLDTERAELPSTPAADRLADADAVVAGLVRPWRVRPLAAWQGATQVLMALASVSNDQRGMLFARGMQIVLDSELLMTDEGAEVDDFAASLVADDGVLRLRTTMSLTPEGEEILDKGLDGAGSAFAVKAEQPWLDAALRLDLRAALDVAKLPPAFERIEGPSEMSEIMQEGGPFAVLYMLTRHPFGLLRRLDDFARSGRLPLSTTSLPVAAQLVWTGMNGEAPRGALALQWPQGGSTSTFDTLMSGIGRMAEVRTHSAERGGAPVSMVALGEDPSTLIDPKAEGRSDALLSARLSLDPIASQLVREPGAKLLQGTLLMTWTHESRALVGELAWAPAGKELEASDVPGSTRHREDSPMGPRVDADAAACLRDAGHQLSRGLRTLSVVGPDQMSKASTTLAEAETALTCAAEHDDTAEAAAGLRRMTVQLAVDVLERSHAYGEASALIRSQCERSKDETLCKLEEERGALPMPTTPEIDWAMECDPSYGLPTGDFVVRMDAKAIAIAGKVTAPADLATRIGEMVARTTASFGMDPPPPPPPPPFGEALPDPKATAELVIDGSTTMDRIRPLLKALIDAEVTEVIIPVRGTRRPKGALVLRLSAKSPSLGPGVAPPPPSGRMGLMGALGPMGEVDWAWFEVSKGVVTTSSSLRPEPQPHASPSTTLLRDSTDDAWTVYVHGGDDATWAEVSAAAGGACPNTILLLDAPTPPAATP